jgi:surfactin synthase thioesterase subunit
MFFAYPDDLPGDVEMCAVQLPGRGPRLSEPPFSRMEPLVDSLANALVGMDDVPVAIFGHSLGALIAFELAHRLYAARQEAPLHLFISGQAAPHMPRRRPAIHLRPSSDIIAELRRLGGTPAEALEDAELLELVLPVVRADFAVCETYTYQHQVPLDCPITVLGGLQDTEANPDELAAWRGYTTADFRLQMFEGDHFYVLSRRSRVVGTIARRLAATDECYASALSDGKAAAHRGDQNGVVEGLV